MTSKFQSNLRGIVHWRRKLLVTFSIWKTGVVSSVRSNNSGPIAAKMNGFVLDEESSFKKLEFPFSFNVDWAFCIVTITKTAST